MHCFVSLHVPHQLWKQPAHISMLAGSFDAQPVQYDSPHFSQNMNECSSSDPSHSAQHSLSHVMQCAKNSVCELSTHSLQHDFPHLSQDDMKRLVEKAQSAQKLFEHSQQ